MAKSEVRRVLNRKDRLQPIVLQLLLTSCLGCGGANKLLIDGLLVAPCYPGPPKSRMGHTAVDIERRILG